MNQPNVEFLTKSVQDPDLLEMVIKNVNEAPGLAEHVEKILVFMDCVTVDLVKPLGSVTLKFAPPVESPTPCWRSYLIGSMMQQLLNYVHPGYFALNGKFTGKIISTYHEDTEFYDVASFEVDGIKHKVLLCVMPGADKPIYAVAVELLAASAPDNWAITPWFNFEILCQLKKLPPPEALARVGKMEEGQIT